MSDGFEKIKELGSQKIYEQTHISRKNIDDLLNKNFSDMNNIQVAGFISILEREYAIDLSALKVEFDAYYRERNQIEEEIEVFIPPVEEEGSKRWPIIGAIVVLLALVMIFSVSKEDGSKPEAVVFTPVGNASEQLQPLMSVPEEENTSVQSVAAEVPETPAEPVLPERIVIRPATELWMGFIDLADYKKSQKLTREPVELDTTKAWLIVFGHGFLSLEVDGEVQKYSERGRLLFVYEDGVIKEIDSETFKARNRGRNW